MVTRAWFLALGKFEALASLASLVHDNPGWAMPEVGPSADRLHARTGASALVRGDARG